MFRNLKAEMVRTGVGIKDMCERLNITQSALFYKMRGHTDWTYKQMKQVQDLLKERGSEQTLDYLFEKGVAGDNKG